VLWFALQVRQQSEKLAASALRNKGYEEFLPLYKCRRHWSDRIKLIDHPLFPGYLFCRLDPQNRLPVLTTVGVIQIVGIGKTPVPVDDAEIRAVQAIVESRLPVQPWPFLCAGQQVRLQGGPLRGLEGIFVSYKNEYRLVVSVTLLERSVAVEVDCDWVVPLRIDVRSASLETGRQRVVGLGQHLGLRWS
jgi:transcription antitermination factor NusG